MSTPITPKSSPVTPGSSKTRRIPNPITLPVAPEIANIVTANSFNEILDNVGNNIEIIENRIDNIEYQMDMDIDIKYLIPIKLHNKSAKMPEIAKLGDAAMDLFASEKTTIPAISEPRIIPGGIIVNRSSNIEKTTMGIPEILNRCLVPTGISMAIPSGYYGRIASRSGLSCKGFDVGAGVIDSGYRGEIKVLMINNSTEIKTFNVGDKIAQLILTKIMDNPILKEVSELPESNRGDNGFGSTGY